MADRRYDREVNREALRNLIERGGVPFRQSVRSWRLSCPKCNKPKLYVEKSSGRCRCMHCGRDVSGWADYVLSKVYPYSQKELDQILFGGVGVGVEFNRDVELTDHWNEWENLDEIVLDVEEPLPPTIVWDPDYVDLDCSAGARGLAYLESRGVPLSVAQRYGIRYSPREKRVAFPIIVGGELRGWQARYVGKTEYFNEEGVRVVIPKIITTGQVGGRVLMFQDRLQGSDHGILTEGPFDGIKCDLCGGNTATMGKSFTDVQAAIYLRSGIRRLYVGLDDDAASRIMQVARDLAPYIELYRLATPKGKEDLGESTFEEVLEEFKSAKRLNPAQVFVYFNPRPPGVTWD